MTSSLSLDRPRNRKPRPGWLVHPWVTARKVTQILALAIFVILFIWSQRGGWPVSLVNLPMRLDPLLVFAQSISSRTLLAGSTVALIIFFLSFVFGRAWCGWVCPLGTTLDLLSFNKSRGKLSSPSEGWRGIKYTLFVTTLVAALLGNLTLLFLDPLTIWFRTMNVSIWPGLDQVITGMEGFIYRVPAFSGLVSSLDQSLRPVLFPTATAFYRDTVLFAVIFITIISLNLFTPRFWCRYLCPLGGMLGLISKVAIFKRRVSSECKECNLCTKVCPTGTINPQKGYQSDPGECTLCMNCLGVCPGTKNTFAPAISTSHWQRYNPGRREILTALGTAVAGVALFRSDLFARRESPFLLRPPGARENSTDVIGFEKCIRCGDCMRACPTHTLQPAISEAGIEGFGTPVLQMRLGFCDYSCNACGQICPVQAIPPLSLAEKRQQVIGKAYIDQNRCIAWADYLPCVVCLEMCPLPQKAVMVHETTVTTFDSSDVTLQLPEVDRTLCIGCGICEFQCPVSGVAAIRVYIPQTQNQF